MFEQIIDHTRSLCPLVHNITNYVTTNDCANMVLACGGSPIMADDAGEVEDVTSICDSLVINIGTLHKQTLPAMIKAGKRANELGHPVILDPVGVGVSRQRTQAVRDLLAEVHFSVIRGNLSEIKAIANGVGTAKGVDAALADTMDCSFDEVIALTRSLASRCNCIIAATGATDVVSDQHHSFLIGNGHPMMSKITGAGCMLTAVMGTWCGANRDNLLQAAAASAAAVGLCGEIAYQKMIETKTGTSSMRTYLIDAMSLLDTPTLLGGMKVEIR